MSRLFLPINFSRYRNDKKQVKERAMNILLIGGSGMLGQSLLHSTWSSKHQWLSIARRSVENPLIPHIKSIEIDLNTPQSSDTWHEIMKNIDIVINCLGIIRERPGQSFKYLHTETPATIFRIAAQHQVKHIIQVSALGAEQPTERLFSEYHRTKQAADLVLTQIGIPYTILYPSVILSPRGDSTALFLSLAALPITSCPSISAPLQPVAIADVLSCIEKIFLHIEQKEQGLTCPNQLILAGSTALTMKALLTYFKQAMGLPSFFLPIPLWMNRMVATAGEYIPSIPLNKEMLSMLEAGNASSQNDIALWLNRPPIPLKQAIASVVNDDHSPIKRKLEQNLLWLSIVFIWIFTAIVSVCHYSEGEQLMSALNQGAYFPTSIYPWAIYGGAMLDAMIGLGLLYRKRQALCLSLWVIALYSLIVTLFHPLLWLDPLGRMSKNIPIIVITWLLLLQSPTNKKA